METDLTFALYCNSKEINNLFLEIVLPEKKPIVENLNPESYYFSRSVNNTTFNILLLNVLEGGCYTRSYSKLVMKSSDAGIILQDSNSMLYYSSRKKPIYLVNLDEFVSVNKEECQTRLFSILDNFILEVSEVKRRIDNQKTHHRFRARKSVLRSSKIVYYCNKCETVSNVFVCPICEQRGKIINHNEYGTETMNFPKDLN